MAERERERVRGPDDQVGGYPAVGMKFRGSACGSEPEADQPVDPALAPSLLPRMGRQANLRRVADLLVAEELRFEHRGAIHDRPPFSRALSLSPGDEVIIDQGRVRRTRRGWPIGMDERPFPPTSFGTVDRAVPRRRGGSGRRRRTPFTGTDG
jgi:hypothetical protein